MLGLCDEHVEVRPCACDHRVKLAVVAFDIDPLARHLAAFLVRRSKGLGDRLLILGVIVDQAAGADHDRLLGLGIKVDVPPRGALAKLARLRVEMDNRTAGDIVEPDVAKLDLCVRNTAERLSPALQSPCAAHLEQIGEVGVKADVDRDRPPDLAVAAHPQPLEGCPVLKEFDPRQMDRFALQPNPTLGGVEVGIRQIDHHRAIIVEQDRAELERLRPAEAKRELREETRVLVEQAIGPERAAREIALTVEHREQIIMLEGAQRALDQTFGRLDVIIFLAL